MVAQRAARTGWSERLYRSQPDDEHERMVETPVPAAERALHTWHTQSGLSPLLNAADGFVVSDQNSCRRVS